MDQLLALRVFVRIAESGGFSKAADAMNLPRATASKLVQDLERHLGTRLLQRTTRRVNVTPEGAAYHERAVRLLAELGDMDEAAARARVQPRGRLRVDVGSSVANQILIPALLAFARSTRSCTWTWASTTGRWTSSARAWTASSAPVCWPTPRWWRVAWPTWTG